MTTLPLPAINLQQPQQQDPVQAIHRILAIKSLLGQQKMQDIQTQQAEQGQRDQQATTKALQDWDGQNPNDLPHLILKNGGSSNAVLNAQGKLIDMRQKAATLDEVTLKNEQTRNDQYRGRVQSIIDADPGQQNALWDAEITKEEQAGTLKPGQVSHTYPGDDQATYYANHFALGSTLAKEAIDAKQANARQTSANAAAGELTLKQNEFNAKTDPNSPLYDPSAAALAKGAAAGDPQMQSILAQQTKQAGAKAGAEAAAKQPYELQLKQQETAQNPVFALNPKTGQRELTTVGDARAQGYTNAIKVSQTDVEKETNLNAQMNDMQLNTSRYRAALDAMGNLSSTDVKNIQRIITNPDIKGMLGDVASTAGWTVGIGSMSQTIAKEAGQAWNELSPDKQDAVIGYLRMKNTGLLAQKVLTGMGRASKEALDIELANMPAPNEGATVGNKKLDAWQENLDQINSRSVKLPWMETPKDVRTRVEGQATDQFNKRSAGNASGGQYKNAQGNRMEVGQDAYDSRTKRYIGAVSKVYADGSYDVKSDWE